MPPFSQQPGRRRRADPQFQAGRRGRGRGGTSCAQLLLAGPYPTRDVEANLADVAAQVAANQRGARDLARLVERYSLPVVEAYMRHIQAAAEQKMRAALARLRRRRLSRSSIIWTTARRSPWRSRSTATRPRSISPAPARSCAGNLNANRAIVTAAVMYVLRCLIAEDIPLNQGVLAPVEIVAAASAC